MIKTLFIKNFALIDKLEISFDKRLNILTGETGSGKSLIIGAIDLAFGARASKDQVKTGKNKAYIELTLNPNNDFPLEILEENGIELTEENSIIISREITSSSTKSRINGVLVSQNYIQGLRKYFLDIHTQNESYNYVNPTLRIELLDNCGQEVYGRILKDYRESFNNLKKTQKELEDLRTAAQEHSQKIDFLKFQIDEIKKTNIDDASEYNELINERSVLLNAEDLKNLAYSSYNLLYGEDESITDVLANIENKLIKACEFDEKLLGFTEIISSNAINLKEVSSELRNYSENLETNPQKLHEVEGRIEILYGIKKKYGPELSDALEKLAGFEAELEKINFSDEKIIKLSVLVEDLEKNTRNLAENLSESRKKLADKLSGMVQDELRKLEMQKVRFCVFVEDLKELTQKGIDSVEFLISPNIGEPLKPLVKIASGGEISRVMLAIKSIFARSDKVNTVIFDEIDSGISGKASQAVAEAFARLAESHQILCITHQSIIAAMADRHIYIQKAQDNAATSVSAEILDKEARLTAISALASGLTKDEDVLNFAQKLLNQAENCKKEAVYYNR